MSRAMFLSMTADKAVAKCEAEKVGVSVVEKLPGGGVRLVCSSASGAEVMRRTLKSALLRDDTVQFNRRPRTPLW